MPNKTRAPLLATKKKVPEFFLYGTTSEREEEASNAGRRSNESCPIANTEPELKKAAGRLAKQEGVSTERGHYSNGG